MNTSINSNKFINKFIAIASLLSPLLLFLSGNNHVFAQTRLETTCSDVAIRRYIFQANDGSNEDFNALVKCNAVAVPTLLWHVTESHSDDLRIVAIAALSQIKTERASIIPALEQLLRDEDPDIRIASTYALKNQGENPVAILAQDLQNFDFNIRKRTIELLAELVILDFDESAVNAIAPFYLDKNSLIRCDLQNVLEVSKYPIAKKILDSSEPPEECPTSNTSVIRNHLRIRARIGTRPIANSARTPLNRKPAMCKVPILRNILAWKCL